MGKKISLWFAVMLLIGCGSVNFQPPYLDVTKDIGDYTEEDLLKAKARRRAELNVAEDARLAEEKALAVDKAADTMTFEQWKKAKEMNSEAYQEYVEYLEYLQYTEKP